MTATTHVHSMSIMSMYEHEHKRCNMQSILHKDVIAQGIVPAPFA